jgi:ABC-type multidrug transport system fused ATPase/permease subunit
LFYIHHLRYWSGLAFDGNQESPSFYIAVYAGITAAGLIISTLRWFVLYNGSIRASTVLYKRLLESILFANIRFHDTVSRGRVLNRFGKDFEGLYQNRCQFHVIETCCTGIDSSLSDNFGRSVIYALSVLTTLITVSVVGGLPFIFATAVLGIVYYNGKDSPKLMSDHELIKMNGSC